jgi:hypothetical protein
MTNATRDALVATYGILVREGWDDADDAPAEEPAPDPSASMDAMCKEIKAARAELVGAIAVVKTLTQALIARESIGPQIPLPMPSKVVVEGHWPISQASSSWPQKIPNLPPEVQKLVDLQRDRERESR